ncbi:hypothetical protein BCD67_10540 [Oscillatoriales cyanobacterium USR001]|nr:hypothetical protein BCD67_10540 [Oscillatoriales cyanobacterium USR001]
MDPITLGFIISTSSAVLAGIILNLVTGNGKAALKADIELEVVRKVREELNRIETHPPKQEIKTISDQILIHDRGIEQEIDLRLKNLKGITVTYAKTTTWTRIEAIKSQVNIALRHTTEISLQLIQESILKRIENKWISKIHVYALDSENLCRAQLSIEIDWDEYNLQISNGKTTVVITEDGRTWIDNTAIELDEAILLFNDYVRDHSLKTKCYTPYAPGVNREEVNRILGMVNGEPIRWKDKANQVFQFKIPEIKELRVGFYCVD